MTKTCEHGNFGRIFYSWDTHHLMDWGVSGGKNSVKHLKFSKGSPNYLDGNQPTV